MSRIFNESRLRLARERRKMTFKALSDRCGMSSKMLSLYEKSPDLHQPTEKAVEKISAALSFPKDFFYQNDIDDLQYEYVAFRSLKSVKASQQSAALGSGKIGILLNTYFEKKFEMPSIDIPELSTFSPEEAALALRNIWGLGDKSISNMINILEAYGVRVFSLSENALEVDAFSFWYDNTPFVFLNTKKSAERSRFDAAHELGHLVLHKDSENKGKDIEREADRFASSFLMPESSIRANIPKLITTNTIINLKNKWRVSAMALAYRLKTLDMLTDWQYRNIMIELSKKGYRTSEPDGVPREKSKLIESLLEELKSNGKDLFHICHDLKLPVDEVCNLLFRVGVAESGENRNISRTASSNYKKPILTIV